MHLNIEQILWALILAGHLVLLIVLLGRNRAGRFPWFTASIALATVSLLANHLLHGKLTTIAFYWQSYTALALDAVIGIFVLVELARHVFSSGKARLLLKPRGWIGGTLVTVSIAIAAVWAWGPWPAWAALKAQPAQLPLLLVILTGMKGQLFVTVLTIQVALLLRIFGARFGFGWRTHVQQIALGLSTNALGFLIVQGITDIIQHTVHPTSRQQYDRIIRLVANLENARTALWFLVLIWWIIWLWRDEPGSSTLAGAQAPVLAVPPPLEAQIPESNEEGNQPGDPNFRD
jgi:hypothetical protein